MELWSSNARAYYKRATLSFMSFALRLADEVPLKVAWVQDSYINVHLPVADGHNEAIFIGSPIMSKLLLPRGFLVCGLSS